MSPTIERREATSTMSVISTFLAATPAAAATPDTKAACTSEVNSAAESGSDTTIATYLLCGAGLGVLRTNLGVSMRCQARVGAMWEREAREANGFKVN